MSVILENKLLLLKLNQLIRIEYLTTDHIPISSRDAATRPLLPIRARCNAHEAPGKVVTVQLRSVSHALVLTLQKHQSKYQNWCDLAAYISATIEGDHVDCLYEIDLLKAAMMRLQLAHVCFFASRVRLRNLPANYSTVGICCVIILRQ